MLFNTDTGELIPFVNYMRVLQTGKWKLRRPLTLPGSPVPLFLEASLIPGGFSGRKRAEAPNPLGRQVGLQRNPVAQLTHLLP